MMMRYLWIGVFLVLLTGLNGCTRIVADSFMRPTLANLQRQTDIDLVCEGTPSFLLMLDSMISSDPENKKLLTTATQAFSAYAAALDVCNKPERAATISSKAKLYGQSLLWGSETLHEPRTTRSLTELQQNLLSFDKTEVDLLFWAGNGWATWIRYQEGSPASLAQLVRLEQIMLRVLELDETYYHGGAHVFLGAYYGSKPPLLGGQLEKSHHHFERALNISNRQFLPTLVLYAQTYAKMTFDRELFVKLLQEVIDFPLESQPDMSLANQVAKRNARKMLTLVDHFFLGGNRVSPHTSTATADNSFLWPDYLQPGAGQN